MKIDRQALIFAGIVLAVILAVALITWFGALFRVPQGETTNPVQDFFSALFPFGDTTVPDEQIGPDGDAPSDGPVPQLRKVSDGPVAGFRFQTNGRLRFVEKESGHVFETETETFPLHRISNTTIPGVDRITWLSDAGFIMRYVDQRTGEVRHFITALASSTPDQLLVGEFFTAATSELLPTGEEDAVLSVIHNEQGTRVERITVSESSGASIFSSPLRSWRLLPTSDELFLETAPSSVTGFLYRLGDGGTLEKLLEGSGLMALPHENGRYVAYSGLANNGLALFILDTETEQTYRAPVATFAEKCSWFKSQQPFLFCAVPATGLPIEEWYMGFRSTNDAVWVMDPTSGVASIVQNLSENAGREIDVWEPEVSPDGKYAAFLNKNDLSLWVLRFEP